MPVFSTIPSRHEEQSARLGQRLTVHRVERQDGPLISGFWLLGEQVRGKLQNIVVYA